jgi:hypothetical protein
MTDELKKLAKEVYEDLNRHLNDPAYSKYYPLWRLCRDISNSEAESGGAMRADRRLALENRLTSIEKKVDALELKAWRIEDKLDGYGELGGEETR